MNDSDYEEGWRVGYHAGTSDKHPSLAVDAECLADALVRAELKADDALRRLAEATKAADRVREAEWDAAVIYKARVNDLLAVLSPKEQDD